jgi:predicted phosphodiesterase
MKLSIISDTHLGHPDCTLVTKQNDQYHTTPYYDALKKTIPEGNEYLLLLGDIIDFGESSYTQAYEAATCFFSQLKRDSLATKQIIYVPGNHDFNFWQAVEHQKNIINPIRKGKKPRDFKWSAPCLFDDRKHVSKPTSHRQDHPYKTIFLDNLTEPKTDFLIAYPNVYLITREGETILFTHGQYFEPFWSMLGEFVANIAYDDLGKEYGASLDIHEFVTLNAPFNILGSSGAGQAGALSDIIHNVKKDFTAKDISKVTTYMNRMSHSISRSMNWYNPLRYYFKFNLALAKLYIRRSLTNAYDARFDKDFMDRREVHKRVQNYYQASLLELENISSPLQLSKKIKAPSHLIFGHTHQPIAWQNSNICQTMVNNPVTLHNTGGWLFSPDGKDKKDFPGANLFHYSSEHGVHSESIRLI